MTKKVAIILADEFEDIELTSPILNISLKMMYQHLRFVMAHYY